MKKLFVIFLWIVIFQVIGYGIGWLTQNNIADWYQQLNKSALNPPDIIFPIIWSILYVMLAILGWMLWENKKYPSGKFDFSLYVIQMIMNWAWTPIFFYFHLIPLGFFWLIIMIFLTVTLALQLKNKNKIAYLILIPYGLWLTFAAYLNWSIWVLN